MKARDKRQAATRKSKVKRQRAKVKKAAGLPLIRVNDE
jgi:hypothetical protein